MATVAVETAKGARTGNLLFAAVTENGSAAHKYLGSHDLHKGPFAARNLADVVHFLCALHGRYPGVIDHAANRSVEPSARAWFNSAVEGFATERGFIARLAVAAGPLPSTPGAGDNDAVLRAQRHALEMLSQSERTGCALGAALALVIDWGVIRSVLNAAAARFGVEAPDYRLMDTSAVRELANSSDGTPTLSRALLFGAQQIALQHHGLWDLLEARQEARGIY
jgi:hypothetical protein